MIIALISQRVQFKESWPNNSQEFISERKTAKGDVDHSTKARWEIRLHLNMNK